MHEVIHFIRYALSHWGYWAVLGSLLGECGGLPLPGETTLVFSSFLAHKGTGLQIQWIILVGIAAAVGGDNIGFFLGRRFGPHFLRWLRRRFHMDEDIDVAKDHIRHHGKATIFWARYIFGLRTIAGPVAGALDMEWREFLLYNFLGAASWVTIMALIGFAFANEFNSLLDFLEKLSWIIAAVVFTIGYLLWRHQKREFRKAHKKETS